jgi:hypothetical protein
MLTPEHVAQLTAFFPTRDHEFLNGLTYITESAITARLDSVDPSWNFQILGTWQRDSQIIVSARLTVCGVSRDGVGMKNIERSSDGTKEHGEAEKSAATDALKRCARLFGIGRYLLDLPGKMNHQSLGAWLAQGNLTSPPPASEPITQGKVVNTEVVTVEVRQLTKAGNKFLFITTRGGQSFLTYSRQQFIEAGWITEDDWKVITGTPIKVTPIPVTIQQVGKKWVLVAVQAMPDVES